MKGELLDQNPKPKRRNVNSSTKIQIFAKFTPGGRTRPGAMQMDIEEHGTLANLRVGSVLPTPDGEVVTTGKRKHEGDVPAAVADLQNQQHRLLAKLERAERENAFDLLPALTAECARLHELHLSIKAQYPCDQ